MSYMIVMGKYWRNTECRKRKLPIISPLPPTPKITTLKDLVMFFQIIHRCVYIYIHAPI